MLPQRGALPLTSAARFVVRNAIIRPIMGIIWVYGCVNGFTCILNLGLIFYLHHHPEIIAVHLLGRQLYCPWHGINGLLLQHSLGTQTQMCRNYNHKYFAKMCTISIVNVEILQIYFACISNYKLEFLQTQSQVMRIAKHHVCYSLVATIWTRNSRYTCIYSLISLENWANCECRI